ncbi:hypothetical protein, partial [Actinoplanes sp. NBRC 101535]|uniref:hypothetical protein n=1 Tax=Actinoplanes sp. NBRC 101535 TaxID=3032196 RepID=UPI0025552D68
MTPARAATPSADRGWAETTWDTATSWATNIPALAWVTIVVVLGLGTLFCLPMLRLQAYKAGQRAGKNRTELTAEDRQDRKLLIAALVPASLFWIAVVIGSARGLTGFGRDDLKWTGGWEYLVPFTLDGIAIAFALLAFRAVKKALNPDKAIHIAWAGMLTSAGLNFLHEAGGGSVLGAVYLAILSILGMLIFHEFLAQFEGGTGHIVRENPKFGLRWITWPTNTLCAWVAWRNHPPRPGAPAAVADAVEHLRQVRYTKALRRARSVDAPPWWIWILPWIRTTQVTAALTDLRAKLAAERQTRVKAEATHRTVVADLNRIADLNRAEVNRLTEQLTRTATDARTAEATRTAEHDAERVTWANRLTTVQGERDTHANRVTQLTHDLNRQTRRVTALTQRLTRQTGRVTTLTRDLNRQTQRFTEANRDLTRQTQRVTELDQELNRQ